MRRTYFFALFFSMVCCTATAQDSNPPLEFPREWAGYLRLQSGLISQTRPAAALFTGGVQGIVLYGFWPHRMRGGLVAGGYYAAGNVDGMLGPTVSVLVKDLGPKYFGSVGNIHVSGEYLFTTTKTRLLGGGVHLDLLNRLMLGLTAHRDWDQRQWWVQTAIAFRLTNPRLTKETFPQ